MKDTIEAFIQLIKTSQERGCNTEGNFDIKFLIELPMTTEEHSFFMETLKKFKNQ